MTDGPGSENDKSLDRVVHDSGAIAARGRFRRKGAVELEGCKYLPGYNLTRSSVASSPILPTGWWVDVE